MWFSFAHQALIELFDNWIETRGGEGGHIEHTADAGAATEDMAHPSLRTAVAIEGRHADELTDTLAIERAQLRQVSQQGKGNHRTDARDTLQDGIFVLPDRGID